jgi:hypothetical protein
MRRVGRRASKSILCAIALAIAAAGICSQAWAADGAQTTSIAKTPHFELWSGAQAYDHVWSLYSGITVSPFGGIQEDGMRLRAVGGYGAYSYSGPRAAGPSSQIVKFHGTAPFADLLIGYHMQLGPLTVKAFGGLMVAENRLQPDDPETTIRGSGAGAKVALETWWNMSDRAWSALDLSWGSLHESYAARARLGWRFVPDLSAGLEAGAAGNVEGDVARVGGFLRYEWASGEFSVSGGVSNDKLLDDVVASSSLAHANVPYATLAWLTRF